MQSLDYFEEAHFILALDADPQDDLTRLAYADWLAERGDPREACLRYLVEFCRANREDDPAARELWAQIVGLNVDKPWRHDVSGRFDVEICRVDSRHSLSIVETLRAITPFPLSGCIDIVNRCRQEETAVLSVRQPLSRAVQLCAELEKREPACNPRMREAKLLRMQEPQWLAIASLEENAEESQDWKLPGGSLTAWRSIGRWPQRHCAIFASQAGAVVLDDIATMSLFAKTSGINPGRFHEYPGILRRLIPTGWRLHSPEPRVTADQIEFYCNDHGRAWILKCEFHAGGCKVSPVERGTREGAFLA